LDVGTAWGDSSAKAAKRAKAAKSLGEPSVSMYKLLTPRNLAVLAVLAAKTIVNSTCYGHMRKTDGNRFGTR
jgi:hypothetical protein